MRKLKVFMPEKCFDGWRVKKEINAFSEKIFVSKEEAQEYYNDCRNEYSSAAEKKD